MNQVENEEKRLAKLKRQVVYWEARLQRVVADVRREEARLRSGQVAYPTRFLARLLR